MPFCGAWLFSGLSFVEGRVEGVEIFAVQPVGENTQSLAEMGHLSRCEFSLYFLGLVKIQPGGNKKKLSSCPFPGYS